MVKIRIGENLGVFVNCGEGFTGYRFATVNLWRVGFWFSTRPTKRAGGQNDGWFKGKVFIQPPSFSR